MIYLGIFIRKFGMNDFVHSFFHEINFIETISAKMYLFKVKNRNTRKRCEIYSKLTIKTTEQRYRRRSNAFIVNFEHILHPFLVFLLLTFNR